MAEPNDRLRGAREQVESPSASGTCLSRQELAELVNAWVFEHAGKRIVELDASYVAKLERGVIRWPREPDRRAGFRTVLGVATDAELGFRRPQRNPTILVGVRRQHFIRTGLRVGAAAVALVSRLPGPPVHVPSVVGMPQVDEVRAAAAEFASWDARYGGGVLRAAVTAQLRYHAELLNAGCSEDVRRELLIAVGSFAETAGSMADDDLAHDDARVMFRFALACAEEAGDWHLRAQVLCSMSYQESWCGDPDEALTCAESALVRAERLTATERAMLHNSRARDLAKLGDVQGALHAVGAADEAFSHARPAEDPPWMASYTEARHLGFSGNVLWELGIHGQFVAETRDRMSTAIATRPEGRARTSNQVRLASLIITTGDPLEAATLGIQALDGIGLLRSQRTTHKLRELRHLSQPHTHLPEIAELHHRIGTILAA